MTDWNNKEEVLEAVREDYGAFEKASTKLQKDKEIFQEVKKRILSDYEDEYLYENSFRQLPKQMRADREIVLAAVELDGESLQWASEELKDDKEVVIASFRADSSFKQGRCLCYASEELKDDKVVVLAAIFSFCTALEFASDTLKADREMVLEAIRWFVDEIHYEEGLEYDDFPIQFAHHSLKTNREFLKEVVEQYL